MKLARVAMAAYIFITPAFANTGNDVIDIPPDTHTNDEIKRCAPAYHRNQVTCAGEELELRKSQKLPSDKCKPIIAAKNACVSAKIYPPFPALEFAWSIEGKYEAAKRRNDTSAICKYAYLTKVAYQSARRDVDYEKWAAIEVRECQ